MMRSTLLKEPLSYVAQQPRAAAMRVAAAVAQDFPLLPTSDTDATPLVSEEPNDNLTPG